MSYTEKGAWIMAIVAFNAIGYYLLMLNDAAAAQVSLTDTSYVGLMIKVSIVWIILSIALHVIAAIVAPDESDMRDERDRKIDRLGELVGQYIVVIAAVGGLAMAALELDHFWIANTLFCGLALGTLLSALVKAAAFRWGSF